VLQDGPTSLLQALLRNLLERMSLHGVQALLPDGDERGVPDLLQALLRNLLERMPLQGVQASSGNLLERMLLHGVQAGLRAAL
jgi:hypothetical protein